jgi:hypothetical protein
VHAPKKSSSNSALNDPGFFHSDASGKKFHANGFLGNNVRVIFKTGLTQGCQIVLNTTYQNGENIPYDHKIYQITTKYTKKTKYKPKWRKNDQMATKYRNSFHCKTIQNLPKMGFLF